MKKNVLAHPGRLLKRELTARELSANRLALDIGVPSGRITDILNARALDHCGHGCPPRSLFRQQSTVLARPAKPIRHRGG
jgi:hypothetical protein